MDSNSIFKTVSVTIWPKAWTRPVAVENVLGSILDLQVEHLTVFTPEKTIAGASIDLGQYLDHLATASQSNQDRYPFPF
jgi:hypothetical protein